VTDTGTSPQSLGLRSPGVAEVGFTELRTRTRALLDRVARGEAVTITVDGRPVAVLGPVVGRPRWLARDEFMREVIRHQADARASGVFRAQSCRDRRAMASAVRAYVYAGQVREGTGVGREHHSSGRLRGGRDHQIVRAPREALLADCDE